MHIEWWRYQTLPLLTADAIEARIRPLSGKEYNLVASAPLAASKLVLGDRLMVKVSYNKKSCSLLSMTAVGLFLVTLI